MSFFSRMASRLQPSTPEEVVLCIKDSFLPLPLPTKTGAGALEEVEKNISSLRKVLTGDGEAGANQEQVLQIALEICKEGVLSLFVQNLPSLGWGVRKDLVICWCILLGQKVDENYCCVKYIEDHTELLDFLVGCYKKSDLAQNCGIMVRECVKHPTLAKYILESDSFELFFEYVELPNFDIASDALSTFKDLLTKHETVVSVFLSSHYEQFFERYTRILTSSNYVTRRQSVKFLSEFLLEASNSKIMKRYIQEVRFLNIMIGLLKDSSKNIRICAFHVFKVFVANPNKPRGIIEALRDNRRELLKLLHGLPASKGEDELDEERDMIIQKIENL
ncbi:degreening-related gene dee76 protein-like isoform X1 [Hordeum vulgare subsp. vulgare]|uniref:Calcium-binding protein 39 n=1 Tax=Hordeum vulgare subsp. vulgare TaxID=112509 RepID=A0A8I6X9Z4_HORVV|nr:degreening-related gene dee76 protein-like isoform X1 [Hordeum vulgare subsp. vulgare]